MKLRSCYFLLVFVLFFALIAICIPYEKEMNVDQAQENIIEKMIVKERTEKNIKMMKSLAEKIISDNEQLCEYFEKGDFDSMAKLYEKRGAIIVTPGYEKIYGKDSAKFWKRVREEGAKLEFKTVNVYLSDVVGEKTIEEKTYDTVASIIQEIHMVVKKEESVLQNDSLLEISVGFHQDRCPWF